MYKEVEEKFILKETINILLLDQNLWTWIFNQEFLLPKYKYLQNSTN